ncbi:hypothetical protein B0A52_08367 [Exophiala mesophila]|uniref:4-coumarate-CoA ligase n=1 Tax=Exophiala mesophila TaxID=212818 RepID=A0A438MTW2_EXOME|nr:hypothetical protein B0A52_08367 [Exophiala mesophila]
MPILSQWSLPIPLVSIPSHIFGSADGHVPDTPFMFDCEHPATRKFSLRDYRDWSKRLAAGLVEGGLQAGDRVMLFSGNSIFTPVVIMGTIMAGGIATTANPAFFPRELAHQLRDSGAKFILVDFDLLDCAQKAASMVNLSEDQIFCFDDTPLTGMSPRPSSIQHWSRLIKDPAAGARFQWEEFSTEAQTHRTAILFYSSGTTGLPKGVEATHRNIVANNCQLIHLQSLDPRFQKMDERGQARSLCALPMYHGLGLVIYTMIAPKRRMSVYLMKKFDGRKMLEYIQRFKITELVFVPPILGWMAKNPLSRSGTVDLSSVQRVLCGAAPLSASVSADFESLWENRQVNVKQAWGMSEFPCVALGWDDRQTSTAASVGELLANCEAKLVNEDNETEIKSRGERGELWVRGPNVMKGYWRNPKATKDTITSDGWLKSGDIAYVDETNKFYIVDRKKELIKVKGSQVAPAELEALLVCCTGIADAAVIGVKNGDDEQPRAYVVRSPGSNITEHQILEYVKQNVAKVKQITGGVVFMDEIPRNPSGKILRKELRALNEREIKQAGPKI